MSEQPISDHDSAHDLRALLSQVAAGQVAPEDASQRIAAAPSAEPSQPPPAPGSGVKVLPAPAGSSDGPGSGPEMPIDRVVIRATASKLVLIGDPTVAGAAVEGPHVARRDGGALIVDTDAEPGAGDFSYEPNARRVGRPFGRWRGGETVVVKVRPDLPVEVSMAAGSIVATRLTGGLRFAVDAGSLKAMDCSGPVDGRVASGSAQLEWLLDRGSSRLRCELGSIKVLLDRRSDVTIKARAELGSVDLGKNSAGGLNAQRELVVGQGTATLDIDVSLGSAKVQVA